MTTNITVYNLSVKLETNEKKIADELERFLDLYYTVEIRGFGANVSNTKRLYASKINNVSEWYLHTLQFAHFYHYLKDKGEHLEATFVDKKQYEVKPTTYTVQPHLKLRDDQIPVYNFLLDKPYKSKLVPLSTGVGKTTISLIAIATLKKRTALIISPQFIEKWSSDIVATHETNYKKVMLIQGSKSVMGIIDMAKSGEITSEYFIFSGRTMQDYISMYEQSPEDCVEMYGCAPVDLFPLLGIGILLIDETHQTFHSTFKILAHMNVEYLIGLSATLISEEEVVSRTHKVVYPTSATYGDKMIKRYIDIYALAYSIPEYNVKKIKTTNHGSNSYSHTAFEKSILKHKNILNEYTKLLVRNIEDYYVADYKAKDKLIIFVATVALADHFTKELTDLYPEKTVVRYCEEDNYDDLMKGEIIVTTVISAGTGLDIPDLRVGIQTVCVSSPVSNIQTAGRLRKLPDRDVKFCYLYCPQIAKHRQYHQKRIEIFRDRAATYNMRRSGYDLR